MCSCCGRLSEQRDREVLLALTQCRRNIIPDSFFCIAGGSNVRQQRNSITSYIDAGTVYGSSQQHFDELLKSAPREATRFIYAFDHLLLSLNNADFWNTLTDLKS